MPKKLIEVALPLDAINAASAREKSIRHGHPSTLHLWWARRPLAACRAVLFASLVDDPGEHPEQWATEAEQDRERQRLFRLIEQLVLWENSNNAQVLAQARAEIGRATGGHPPPVLDPFCGGGSIPLEAQRLGLEAHGSDLNPVAVLITKALIEIPPRFAGQPPVNPAARRKMGAQSAWQGAAGLAEDVRYYGQWMRDEAQRRIGHLYPKVTLPPEQGGGEATVIAWLWARTVPCPNPACGAQMPLVRSFALSTKAGKQAWVEPQIDRTQQPPAVRFAVRTSGEKGLGGTVNRKGGTCIVCHTPVPFDHIRAEGRAGHMRTQLMAVVAEGQRRRVYLSPDEEQAFTASQARPEWEPAAELPHNPRDFKTPNYGMITFGDLFTPRQLVALNAFSDLIAKVREQVARDAAAAGIANDSLTLDDGGNGATAYSDAVATYLAFAIDRLANRASTICIWNTIGEKVEQTFGRQAIPMVWDFAEANVFADGTGSWSGSLEWVPKVLEVSPNPTRANVKQLDAAATITDIKQPLISTDPPYYDNIGYADLSDFFYIWLRRALNKVYPNLFSTVLVPKAQELVATPYRFDGDAQKAQQFFEEGLGKAFARIRAAAHPNYPVSVYYGFKQAELDEDSDDKEGTTTELASTGWETMLEGLLRSGFQITGTWPLRTERDYGLKTGNNVLASSIVLVCRPRPADAPLATRRDFLTALKRELPTALRQLQHGNVAPVDLAQAAIGPGMAVFSRYGRVIESDGAPMRVRTALQLINQTLDEVLAAQEGEYDADTRWAVAWFEQYAHNEGPFGVAETLSKAKVTSVGGMVEAGFLASRGGKVRLLRRDELDESWDPLSDRRLTLWEVTQQLIRALDREGEGGAARLLRAVGGDLGERARDLAYRLYTTCERKGWAAEALAYNSLVVAWPPIVQQAQGLPAAPVQGQLFGR